MISEDQGALLRAQLDFERELNEITSEIHGSPSINFILANLSQRMSHLLQCERLTIYALNTKKNQLYSISTKPPRLITIPRDPKSIAGYCALTRSVVNIANAYDCSELAQIHPKLNFDRRWDQMLQFRTAQVLACPLIFDKYLLGVLQLINKKEGSYFSEKDIEAAREISRTLAVAFYNHNRADVKRPQATGKFYDLVDKKVISQDQLKKAQSLAKETNQDLATVIMSQFKVPRSTIGESLSSFYHCQFFNYQTQTVPIALQAQTQLEFWKKIGSAPLSLCNGTLVIAMPDPHALNKIDIIKSLNLAPRIEIMVALTQDIMDYLDHSYNLDDNLPTEKFEDEMQLILSELGDAEVLPEDAEPEEEVETEEVQGAIVRLANKIIIDAEAQSVSDIHIEPNGNEKPCVIRFRRDGECYRYLEIPSEHRSALISRVKIMANLDISEKRKPQDGKIRFNLPSGRPIELRVAVVPTSGSNEDVVMRLLAAGKPLPLEKLAMSKDNYNRFKEVVKNPYGLILCVGPTGSGKTTTLHSALGHINNDKVKIWTAEDPVEITQEGLRQVQVQPQIGFTFAAALRSFLRADPDVVMIGEMRDSETASIGIEASLTGHLVFSTLHTNSAPETVTRLLDMGLDPFNFADALLGILAQRLVRTLCVHCKQAYVPSEEEYFMLREQYGAEAFDLNIGQPYHSGLTFQRAVGCAHCADSGYRGRMGLHELLLGSDEIKKLILHKANVDIIRQQAFNEGMTSLLQDGISKIFDGFTDYQQVRTVCMR